MRKGISILFSLLILISGVHFNIAMHFCGGELVATKVSLAGKLATCGMELRNDIAPLWGTSIASHCCDNKLSTIGILNNFTPHTSVITEKTLNFQILYYLPLSQRSYSTTAQIDFYSNISPPGRFAASSVNLDDICISKT